MWRRTGESRTGYSSVDWRSHYFKDAYGTENRTCISCAGVHLKDASQNASVASRLLNSQMKAELINELDAEYQALREKSGLLRRETVSLEEAQKNKLNLF